MIQSMTGYGKAICELSDKKIVIEIKSLNSKQLDLGIRLPMCYKEKELLIRNIISEKLERGKIEISIQIENQTNSLSKNINKEVVKAYISQLTDIVNELNLPNQDIIGSVMKLPDVMISETESIDDTEWLQLEKTLNEAIEEIIKYRKEEGNALEKDLIKRIDIINNALISIAELEDERLLKIKDRISNSLEEYIGADKIDKNRYEQEIIYYLEKIDITEEKVRLKQHCDFFIENLTPNKQIGKKLNFISQEIGREINTIGSKANHAEMQKLVIMMKDELEKIKEQSLNIL